jgi:UbiD family decarboxylase
MGYRNLRRCVDDLKAAGQLVILDDEIDAHLEAAEIHRRVYRNGGPAVFFARVTGCRFPMVSNLFGTMQRARYIFRDSLDAVRQVIVPARFLAEKVDAGRFSVQFDLKQDPGETTNVAQQRPGIVQRLQRSAEAARDDLGDTLNKCVGKGTRPAGRLQSDDQRLVW